jgi:moderate conductance mechanosensitive channel
MTLDDLEHWARSDGLEALLIAMGSVLLARVVRSIADSLVDHAERREKETREVNLVASEESKREGAVAQVVGWTSVFLIYFVAILLVLSHLNVPLSSLVAPAAVIGAAVGFGAQRLVQDLLSGFFIFAERQFGYGDVIRIAPPGAAAGVLGTVEEVTLRATKLRTESGELVVVPNGEIRQVTNLSKDWARVVLDIPLAVDADIPKATEILHRISDEISTDEDWAPLLLDSPSVMGIQKFAVGFLQLRFVARTLPGKQWDVARELRGRIAERFREAGVVVAQPLVAAEGLPRA